VRLVAGLLLPIPKTQAAGESESAKMVVLDDLKVEFSAFFERQEYSDSNLFYC
jgi:hypothetical protein